MNDVSILSVALINAAILIGIAVLFLVIHLRGGRKPGRQPKKPGDGVGIRGATAR